MTPPLFAPVQRARRVARALLRSDRGAVSIEVVILTPLMLLVLLGFGELYLFMRATSLVEHTAFTLADSLGQMSYVYNTNATSNSADLGTIWNAATLLAQPDALQGRGGVIVTSVCDASTACSGPPVGAPSMAAGTPEIWWTAQAPWTPSGMTSQVTAANVLPSAWPFRQGDSAIIVEVFYSYTPFLMTQAFWPTAPGSGTTIYKRVYVYPRTGKPLPLLAAPS
jgi:Flp pilus assembly protein TadG